MVSGTDVDVVTIVAGGASSASSTAWSPPQAAAEATKNGIIDGQRFSRGVPERAQRKRLVVVRGGDPS